MGPKHPLDIFRTTDSGFDSASRGRRTVQGKVMASAPRAPAGPAGASRSTRAGSPGGTRPAQRKLLYGVVAIVGVLSIYLVGANSGANSGATIGTTPALKAGSAAAGTARHAVQVLDVLGSEASRTLAIALRDRLHAAGYPDAQVLGYPPVRDGIHARYSVTVGLAADAAGLQPLLANVQALPGPAADPDMFQRAVLVEIPR